MVLSPTGRGSRSSISDRRDQGPTSPAPSGRGCHDGPVTGRPSGPAPASSGRESRVGRLARWAEGTVVGDLLAEVRRTRLLDVAYTIAAQSFVALIPLVLVVTAAFLGRGDQAVVSRQLIDRFGLVGAARQAVQVLFETPGAGSGVYWFGILLSLYSAFSLSRRVARAYVTIWDVRPLPVNRQWVGLV